MRFGFFSWGLYLGRDACSGAKTHSLSSFKTLGSSPEDIVMPLNLHANCRTRLRELLIDALPDIKAKNGMFIERLTAARLILADAILPRTGQFRERLLEYIGDFPLADFVIEVLGQELWELDRYLFDQTPNIPDIPEYADVPATADRLLTDFESLPWSYRVTIPLPEALDGLLPPGYDSLDLSPSVRLVRATGEFISEFPLTHSNGQRTRRMGGTSLGLLGLLSDPKWETDRMYLQISTDGFINQYGTSATAHTALRLLRSFCGLGIATRLFKYEYAYSATPFKSSPYVHRKSSDGIWSPATRFDLDESISHGLSGLKLHDLNGKLDTDDLQYAWRLHQLQRLASVFRAGNSGEQIKLASQWLFDGHAGHDQLLSFVQSMVVMEILLGDKSISDEIGIGALISNRFAYLIGSTHEERAELLADFKQIYKVRSQIVHSGKHKLSAEENSLYMRLRWMCHRIIDKEVELLKASLEKQVPAIEQK
jgi:hypothetical protein